MTTMNVLDSAGSTVAVEKPNANGRGAANASRPVVLSNEDLAALQAIVTALGTPFQHGDSVGNTAFALNAGEAHIGKLGGETNVVAVAPAVTAGSAYASGQVIGGLMAFSGLGRVAGGTGLMQMASIQCKSAQSFACDLILFHTNPTATTFTDKAALALNAADFDKIIGVISFTASNWTSLGTPSFAQALQLGMAFKLAGGQVDAYGVLVARGTPTFASTSDIKSVVKALLD